MALDPLTAGLDLASSVIKRIWPDPADQAKAQRAMAELKQNGDLQKMAIDAGLMQGQIQINKAEAQNPNWFVAAPRAFIMWTCGIALFSQYILIPWAQWVAELLGKMVAFPHIDSAGLFTLLTGLLGLGGMRSWEKSKGVNNQHG